MQSASNGPSQNGYAMQVGNNVAADACPRIEPSVSTLVARLLNMVSEAEARATSAAEIVDRLNGAGCCGNKDAAEPQPSGVLSEFEYALRRLSSALASSDASLSEIARKIG